MAEEIKDGKQDETNDEQSALQFLTENINNMWKEEEPSVEPKDNPEDKPEEKEDSTPVVEDGDAEEDKPEKEPEGEVKEEEYEDVPIPQEQVDIARSLGFSDDEIIKMAETTPVRLEQMVRLYQTPKRGVEEKTPEVPAKEGPVKVDRLKPEDFGDLDSDVATAVSEKMNSLIDTINKQNEQLYSLGERSSKVEQRNQQEETRRIDTMFDNASEFVPEFGTAGSLTKAQAQARTEVYAIANIMQKTRGIGESEAMEEAMYLYGLGQLDIEQLEAEAEERVKEKVNNNKKLMSPRPSNTKNKGEVKSGRKAAMQHLEEGLKEMFSD